ncbi:DMT family transporter [Campylobacter troglodytis]|uniref:DMT family transporter n=1 Tax=Campylobacter troglodytis TaxID=654363 RepID=UPI00115AA0D1|nr:multidrug efflux SMR transporter [Campylobacter troglodytis]TQR60749.1 QacE family quaternary ammonium compound efflux SMR transporter [Campylobacter troglodytis]
MSWVFLFIAGLFEIAGVAIMKQFALTGKKFFILILLFQFALSFACLSLAMQGISMSVAYAIWTGIGAAGGVLVGILFYKESKKPSKLFYLGLIIISSVGLKFLS